jgi:hypothetical protein
MKSDVALEKPAAVVLKLAKMRDRVGPFLISIMDLPQKNVEGVILVNESGDRT